MNERVKQFRVGVVVLLTSIIGGLLITLNSPAPRDWVPGLKSTYQVTIKLDRAPGIGPNTPVRKNGLLIGRVESVEDMQDHILVRASIDKDRLLYPHYECIVRTSVLGDASIEFIATPAPTQARPEPSATPPTSGAPSTSAGVTPVAAQMPPDAPPVPPAVGQVGEGHVFEGRVAPNPLEGVAQIADLQDELKEMIVSLERAGDEVAKLSMRVNEAIGDDTEPGRIPRLLDTTEVALQDFTLAAQKVREFFDDPHLREMSREARLTMQDVREAANDVRDAATSAERNLKNLEGFTEPIGRRGEDVASALVDNLDGLGRIVEELTVLVESVNNREGTIGRLIHNPEVYDNLNRLLVNSNHVMLRINDLTSRLRVVVEDARVFMDKIAREPGRIVGGALNTGPGIK